MARIYLLDEVAALFRVDAATLRRWSRRQHVTPHVDPADCRRRYLDHEQLLALATAHKRVLVDLPSTDVQIAELTSRIERLEALFQSEDDLPGMMRLDTRQVL